MNKVDIFWNKHTMKRGIKMFYQNVHDSDTALIIREQPYSLARQLVGPYETYDTVLDYGCGPGHDVIGFLKNTSTKKIIAFDISKKSLTILKHRLSLYGKSFERKVKILQGSDENPTIKVKHDSVDHVNCIGVLQHCSFPQEIIDEFYRVLKPNGTATIMVYNRDSLYFHLYVAYYHRIVKNDCSELSADKAFSYFTDSKQCPLSIAYKPDQFIDLCADFDVVYKGGYFLNKELQLFRSFKTLALSNPKLEEEHKTFLSNVNTSKLYPTYNGYYCGVGGVYHLTKRG